MSEKSVNEAVSFGERLASSQAFADLFRDGLALVEETAAYLDGPGRQESKKLERNGALAYATESMRLTTRLMQLASNGGGYAARREDYEHFERVQKRTTAMGQELTAQRQQTQ